jgi:hypothetical protein
MGALHLCNDGTGGVHHWRGNVRKDTDPGPDFIDEQQAGTAGAADDEYQETEYADQFCA